MSLLFDLLVGRFLIGVNSLDDYFYITLDDGATLYIYNNHIILNEVHPSNVADVTEDEDGITIVLIPTGTIKIGMRDADFHGPEAMSYKGKGKLVVWP